MCTEAEDVSHQSLLEQETKGLKSELDTYWEKLCELNRSKSEIIYRIDEEVREGRGGEFAVAPTPRPAMEQMVK